MKKAAICLALSLLLTFTASASDLYKVKLHSHGEAQFLNKSDVNVLLWVRDGYLILTEEGQPETLKQAGLDLEFIASGVRRNQLAMDGRFDRKNAEMFEVLYEDGRVRLLLAGADRLALSDDPVEVFPMPARQLDAVFYPPLAGLDIEAAHTAIDGLDTLMAKIEQDSLESYVNRLQAFYRRLTGTDSSYAARDWIAAKFSEFGYDSIVIDPFIGSQLWDRVPCQSYNVIAYKPGTKYPEKQIIIGGHFDAVPNCPGADDNASGTATVLEIARILSSIETDMTIIFIAFDSEESWMWGSYHYVDGVIARNDDIVLMINPDMVAHHTNSTRADLYYGPETAYAQLWDNLANTYVGINADLSGSTASDHLPFQQAGYDVIFVQEKFFSSEYHEPTDSTAYMDFEYMTRMVKATFATLYTVDQYPPPIRIAAVMEPGNGYEQLVVWEPVDETAIAFYRVSWYRTLSPGTVFSVDLPSAESSYTVDGLTEEEECAFFVQAFDADGNTSFAYDPAYGTPSTKPESPRNISAVPQHEAILVEWDYSNTELDFDHCAIIRDGIIVGQTLNDFYMDNDPALGSDMHYYYVTAVDTDGNHSDTVGIEPFWMKAAALQPDRILAVNRTSIHNIDFVDETETGAFMREALAGYNFDYYSDTAATTYTGDPVQLDLIDMVDYGIMILGAETGRYEDLGGDPGLNGIMDTLAYYMSIGGKVIIFGRWGYLGDYHTINYFETAQDYDDAYYDYFHINERTQTPTTWNYSNTIQYCDLIGANSEIPGYPDLVWDSVATVAHSTSQYLTITGTPAIPCASFSQLRGPDPEIIYTYDSRSDDHTSRGQPVAWRYIGPDYQYVYFEIPLSFFESEPAAQALCAAVEDLMGGSTPAGETPEGENLPGSFALDQNYPNPFNPTTAIHYTLPSRSRVTLSIYNILGQRVATLIDGEQPAGTHTVTWNGTDDSGNALATGIYLYQLRTDDYAGSRKMLLLK